MPKSASTTKPVLVYQLKITLDRIRPPVWRRVLVLADTMLPELHDLIQAVMGWHDSHLHVFEVRDGYYGPPDVDIGEDMKNEDRFRLSQIARAQTSKFHYEYDFGDDWRHTILLEKILPAEPGRTYPICVTGRRACPPEDCGGPWGYAGLLQAISDPENEEHEDMLEWVGGEFDPDAFSVENVNAKLHTMGLAAKYPASE